MSGSDKIADMVESCDSGGYSTPILSAISLIEILQEAKILGSRSFRYIEGFTIVGVLFMAVSLVASFIVVRVTTIVTRKYSM